MKQKRSAEVGVCSWVHTRNLKSLASFTTSNVFKVCTRVCLVCKKWACLTLSDISGVKMERLLSKSSSHYACHKYMEKNAGTYSNVQLTETCVVVSFQSLLPTITFRHLLCQQFTDQWALMFQVAASYREAVVYGRFNHNSCKRGAVFQQLDIQVLVALRLILLF